MQAPSGPASPHSTITGMEPRCCPGTDRPGSWGVRITPEGEYHEEQVIEICHRIGLGRTPGKSGVLPSPLRSAAKGQRLYRYGEGCFGEILHYGGDLLGRIEEPEAEADRAVSWERTDCLMRQRCAMVAGAGRDTVLFR